MLTKSLHTYFKGGTGYGITFSSDIMDQYLQRFNVKSDHHERKDSSGTGSRMKNKLCICNYDTLLLCYVNIRADML